MKEEKNHIHYSTEYLRKYLNGELTVQEMQALEKDALEDPFLSDAIEGLEVAGKHSISFESSVADLQRRHAERVRKRKKKRGIVFMFPRWQVAASILILAAMTTFTITRIKHDSTQKTISSVDKKDTQLTTVHPAPAMVKNNADTIKIERKAEPPELAPIMQGDEKDKGIVAKRHQAAASTTDFNKAKQPDSLHYIQGLVLDDSGKAIESAIVSLYAQGKSTATDSNGYFKLYLKNIKKDQEIAINSLGFKSVNAVVSDSSLFRFRMQNATSQLNEVVVTGYGIQRKKDVTGSVTIVSAKNSQPEGWQALNNYINENKKINNGDSVLKGEEIVSFIVNKKGKLSSFKIIKSISSSHDVESIRLLKSGPKLQTTDGKKQKCQISIFFN
jgi:CarboxypepD_reg-like domain